MSGLTGHINHLYEDPNLTLGDVVKIYRSIAEHRNDFEIYEKIDGYNVYLSFSVTDKKLKILRNNSQIKSGGITIEQLKTEYTTNKVQAGKEPVPSNVVMAHVGILTYLENLIKTELVSDDERKMIFGDTLGMPEYFFNAEIVDPYAPNVIKYDRKMIVFHKLGNIKVNTQDGTIVDSDSEEISQHFDLLSKLFVNKDKVEITDDKPSKIDTVNKVNLERELGALRAEFKRFGLDMNDTFGKYFIKAVEKYLKDKKSNLDSSQVEFVVKSILAVGFGSKFLKKPRLTDTFGSNTYSAKPELKEFTNEEPAKEIFRTLRTPIEKILFECSSILLDKYQSAYISNNKQTADDIIKLINSAIENVQSKGSAEQKKKLSKNMDKLRSSSISFSELINNPVEGIVFRYKDHTYKITSSFGPVNQIVGMSKFGFPLNEGKTVEANGIKVLFAGAFKPPHKGHLQVIKNFINLPNLNRKNFTVEKIIVIIGDKPRYSTNKEEFNLKQSLELFRLYISSAGLSELVELRVTQRDNPVKDVYDYIANTNNDSDKAQPGDVILLGASQKDKSYYSNLAKFVKDKPWQVLFGEEYEVPMVYKDENNQGQDLLGEYSATEFRNAISDNNTKKVDSFLPQEILSSQELKDKAYKILGLQPVEEIKENKIIEIINNKMSIPLERTPKINLGELINRVSSIYNK